MLLQLHEQHLVCGDGGGPPVRLAEELQRGRGGQALDPRPEDGLGVPASCPQLRPALLQHLALRRRLPPY